jgi:hypothetical protein
MQQRAREETATNDGHQQCGSDTHDGGTWLSHPPITFHPMATSTASTSAATPVWRKPLLCRPMMLALIGSSWE